MEYLWLKWLHIVSATLLFGTGLGIAFFLWMAHRSGDARLIAHTARHVVIADGLFTTPAVVVQLASGLWLAHMLGLSLTQGWVMWSLLLFFAVGACWIPVLKLQMRARDLATRAVSEGRPLPAEYFRLMRWWFALGWPAFIGVLAILWLMVRKPG
jgi:uncharacterized membrane protein